MASYLISKQTQRSLIEAAGELFARRGITGVTTREIARAARCAQNAITYHFGGIQGLIDAVWDFVCAEWDAGAIATLIEKEAPHCRTRQEKTSLIRQSIQMLFQIFYRVDRPRWISKFLVRAALSEEGRKYVAEEISGKVAPSLIELFLLFSGSNDREAAQCWCLRILAAPVVFTANLTGIVKFEDESGANLALYRTLEDVTCREALFAAGLLPEDHFSAIEKENI